MRRVFWLLALSTAGAVRAGGPVPQAPPPAMPALERSLAEPERAARPLAAQLYSVGEPTDAEQLCVEYINRARANPAAEGQRLATTTDPDVAWAYEYFGVNLGLMKSELSACSAVPPLAINEAMTRAARGHSQDMFDHQFQEHLGSDGGTLGQRLINAGYPYTGCAENIYVYAKSVWHGHAGFMTDWDRVPNGMQPGRGHRVNILSGNYREVGIGIIEGINGTVGPLVITQDFGTRTGLHPLITGVVYYDFNGNQFYDLGEGLGGVRISVAGGPYYALTAGSGGYALPVSGDGVHAVSLSAPGLQEVVRMVTISGGKNAKLDYAPAYAPPVISGSTVAFVNWDNPYVFSPVGGATGYDWRVLRRTNWTVVEGAENGTSTMIVAASAGYGVVTTTVKRSGEAAYHLAHPSPPTDQALTLRNPIRLGATSVLSFYSRLAHASIDQIARAQISTDDGASWVDVWTQAGTDGAGEATFQLHRISLAPYAGQTIRLRFAYTFEQGSFYPQTSDMAGFFLDDVIISESESLGDESVSPVKSGAQFVFRATAAGSYLLQVRARTARRALAWGPGLAIVAEAIGGTAPVVKLIRITRMPDGRMELRWRLESGTAAGYQLWSAARPTGPWASVATPVEAAGTPKEFRALVVPSGPAQFYRVEVQ